MVCEGCRNCFKCCRCGVEARGYNEQQKGGVARRRNSSLPSSFRIARLGTVLLTILRVFLVGGRETPLDLNSPGSFLVPTTEAPILYDNGCHVENNHRETLDCVYSHFTSTGFYSHFTSKGILQPFHIANLYSHFTSVGNGSFHNGGVQDNDREISAAMDCLLPHGWVPGVCLAVVVFSDPDVDRTSAVTLYSPFASCF